MTPEVFLIISLVDATIPHEPIRFGVTNPIAKGGVESKACFVDEVIHVALDAAVIVAAKDHTLSPSNKDPPRKVN
jgi:hypothetical protein